jgi:hypothetical protein
MDSEEAMTCTMAKETPIYLTQRSREAEAQRAWEGGFPDGGPEPRRGARKHKRTKRSWRKGIDMHLFLSLKSAHSAVMGQTRPAHHGAVHVGLKKKSFMSFLFFCADFLQASLRLCLSASLRDKSEFVFP